MLASTARAAGKEKGLEHNLNMLPKSSPRTPKSLPRAPKELPRSSTELPRTSKERPRSPQISQQSPSSFQGLSKVPLGRILGRFGLPNWGLGADVGSLSELSSSSCKPERYLWYSLRLLTFSLLSLHFSHCIYPLECFAQSSEIPGGSTRALLRSERGRAREIEIQCSSRETLNILKRVGGTRGAITIQL